MDGVVDVRKGAHTAGTRKDGRRRRIGAALMAATILVAIGCCIAYLATRGSSSDGWFDAQARNGFYEGMTEEEIQAAIDAEVAAGEMNISIRSIIRIDAATMSGTANIENIEANDVDQMVEIYLTDDPEPVLYQSGAIAPGQYIEDITLARKLEPGTYDVTALFVGYDRESRGKVGQAAAEIQLVVS